MKGLILSESFFEEFGRPMLESEFSDIMPYLCAGLLGSGSECMGYDDEISEDHDFEPGFCIFLPGEDIIDRKEAFRLERAYAKLPKEYMGYKRSVMQPVGGARHGVIRISDFLTEKTGTADGMLSSEEWLHVPSESLAEVTNGKIFFDNYGEMTLKRDILGKYPSDIRLKKLAGRLLMMAEAGQYNYMRCLKHGEQAAAQMSVFEFTKHTIEAVILLNEKYMPYYKWSFRALRELDRLSVTAELLEYLISSDNDENNAEEKIKVIEGIAADIIDELNEQGITKAVCMDLEKHAYSVNDMVGDLTLRNMHILAAV